MTLKYGVVQGRLSPQAGNFIQDFPYKTWRKEFQIAKEIGATHIEWIDGAPNESLRQLSTITNTLEVPISAICIDWFTTMKHSLSDKSVVSSSRLIETLYDMNDKLNVKTVVLPLLENASLLNWKKFDKRAYNAVVNDLYFISGEFQDIKFSIETDLDYQDLLEFYHNVGSENVHVTFDTGNLTKRGYNLKKHFDSCYQLIDNIHIKDCVIGGPTVELGKGQTDLSVLKHLKDAPRVDYITFQTARFPGSEIDTFYHNRNMIEKICNV